MKNLNYIEKFNDLALAGLMQERDAFDLTYLHAVRNFLMGLEVVPIRYNSKVPAINLKRLLVCITSLEDINNWFAFNVDPHEKLNIGTATGRLSGIVVIDADDAEAQNVIEGSVPATPWKVKTPRGMHYYYRYPINGGGVPSQNGVSINGKKVNADIRGDDSIVVTAPSIIKGSTENLYREVEPFENHRKSDLPYFNVEWIKVTENNGIEKNDFENLVDAL